MDPSPTIAQQLAALPRLTVKDLQRRYAEAFGDETVARNKAWLVKRIAWKVQANAHGGLTDRARARAAELAAGAELRTTIPAKRSAPTPAPVADPAEPEAATLPFPADRRRPPPGSIITRVYKGQTVQVRVLTHGFEYAGLVYPSLSAVAKAVTGSHCNGYLFFRLTKGGDA
ncbi:DUF2924 domain-containing protein [Limnoglobus roseus]|uniref:DUF2924 domain-containing protein n=1 Tax=Limnoglobus roseus TaxID=2598579 RepID=A0A5C1AP32_9BACT|nr:DUF2924 domain-containing protein [Limnoglobus roseus]QEL20760.1 hypothetical protein PX52LOC_07872 [Limnoglobus roseus]